MPFFGVSTSPDPLLLDVNYFCHSRDNDTTIAAPTLPYRENIDYPPCWFIEPLVGVEYNDEPYRVS